VEPPKPSSRKEWKAGPAPGAPTGLCRTAHAARTPAQPWSRLGIRTRTHPKDQTPAREASCQAGGGEAAGLTRQRHFCDNVRQDPLPQHRKRARLAVAAAGDHVGGDVVPPCGSSAACLEPSRVGGRAGRQRQAGRQGQARPGGRPPGLAPASPTAKSSSGPILGRLSRTARSYRGIASRPAVPPSSAPPYSRAASCGVRRPAARQRGRGIGCAARRRTLPAGQPEARPIE
jgi:hypothetical protein